MRAILSLFGAEVRGAQVAASGNRGRLRAIVLASFSPTSFRREAVSAWLNFYVLAQTAPAARRLLAVYQRRLHSNLMYDLRPLIGPRAASVAEGLGALIDGVYIRAALQPGTLDRNSAAALVLDYLDRELGDA